MKLWTSTLATALLTTSLVTAADAQFSCSTVARAGQIDPDGVVYGNTFRDEVAINASGDTVFVAKASGAPDKLYFYPGAGAAQVVARSDGPAPGGGTFRSQRAFFALSVNNAANVAFLGELVAGEGVFVRDGGVLEIGALRSQASPGGGVFDSFPMVGDIDAASRVPFVATVDGGPGGVFAYASSSNTVSTVVLDGAATLDGRQICSTSAVDLGNGSFAALRAFSKVNCADGGETAKTGIFVVTGAGISTIVLNGDASPIGGSTFSKFVETPQINATNDIAFHASTIGTTKTDGIFVWDFATATTSTRVRKGDAAPGVGGSVSSNLSFDFTDAGDVYLNAKLRATSAKVGILDFGAVDAPILVKTTPAPVDAFGPGSSFVRLSPQNGTSNDGSRVGLYARIKDTIPPSLKAAVIRCVGSPSGAFIDGAACLLNEGTRPLAPSGGARRGPTARARRSVRRSPCAARVHDGRAACRASPASPARCARRSPAARVHETVPVVPLAALGARLRLACTQRCRRGGSSDSLLAHARARRMAFSGQASTHRPQARQSAARTANACLPPCASVFSQPIQDCAERSAALSLPSSKTSYGHTSTQSALASQRSRSITGRSRPAASSQRSGGRIRVRVGSGIAVAPASCTTSGTG